MKKKLAFLAVGSAVALIAPLSVAIPAKAALPSITIWVDAPRLPGAQLYAQVMKGKVNVKVELHAQGDLVAKIALFNRVKKGWPDVVFGPPNDVSVLRDAGNALALDSYASKAFWADMMPGNKWCQDPVDKKFYCVKNDMAQSVLWVNTKLMKQFNYTVPTTMEQFAAIGADLAKNHPGYSLGPLGDQGLNANYLWPSQCPILNVVGQGKIRIAPKDPKCTRVATLIQPLVTSGVLSTSAGWDADFVKDYGQTDKVVMNIGPSWYGEFVIRPAASWNVPAGEIATYPMPKWPGESVAYSGEYGGGIYTVSPHSKFPKEALAFAQFMVQDKRNVVDVKNPDGSHGAPTFPASKIGNALWHSKISTDKYYASDPYPAMLTQSKVISTAENPVSFDANGALGGTMNNTLKDKKDVQAAIDAFATYVTGLAKNLGYQVLSS